jgi:TetR/AcrR family transcriptional regulator
MSEPITPTRDAERSKAAILNAATELFCAKGFNATSIGDIAKAAGLARGTPAYFFGSKEDLYKVVLEAVLKKSQQIIPNALEQAGTNRNPERLIEVFTDAYMDFHHHNPEFLRLMHWIALEQNRLMLEVQAHWLSITQIMQSVMMTVTGTALAHEDQRQLVLSIIGICNAHLMYGQTLAEPMGLEPSSLEFLEARKIHVKKILKAALQTEVNHEK